MAVRKVLPMERPVIWSPFAAAMISSAMAKLWLSQPWSKLASRRTVSPSAME